MLACIYNDIQIITRVNNWGLPFSCRSPHHINSNLSECGAIVIKCDLMLASVNISFSKVSETLYLIPKQKTVIVLFKVLKENNVFNYILLPNTNLLQTFYHNVTCEGVWKVKSQKNWTPRKIQNGKFLLKWQNQKLKHIKWMDNNCHVPDWYMHFLMLKIVDWQ